MLDMAKKDILPACLAYEKSLAETAAAKKAIGLSVENAPETALVKRIDGLCAELAARTEAVEKKAESAKNITGVLEKAHFVCDELHTAMSSLRATADELETMVSAEYWPFPTYRDLLFSV